MRISTTHWRWLLVVVAVVGFASTAQAQRNVTLRLNTATIPDTIRTDSFIEVRGAVEGSSPVTLYDGNVIDWSDQSTLEPTNVGGDYWDIEFQIADTTELTFKFYSQQAQDLGIDGWEADPNPTIPPGSNDTTLTVHYFEPQAEYRGATGDRGEYDWRPYEEKEDSIAIWFRVAMFGDEAQNDGYDPESETQVIGVRGGAPISDWSSNFVNLERESTNSTFPGYRIYSGVAYAHESTAGETQAYKFVIQNGENVAFEEGSLTGDRTFVVPEQDTTLHWVYYGDTAPTAGEAVESLVIFSVDLTPFETIGVFDRARGDTLWAFGSFNDWQNCPDVTPDDCLMAPVPGEDQFELGVPMNRVPGVLISYKYFLDFNDETFQAEFGVEPPSGWEEGHATGINRSHEYENAEVQDLGLAYFNDVHPLNVIPEGQSVDVHFAVDMTPAFDNDAQPFDPAAGDSVTVRLADPIWAFTQGIVVDGRDGGDFPLAIDEFILEDPDGDDVYEGTFTVEGPTYSILTFRYAYGQGTTFFEDQGLDPGLTPGRNRTQFIDPNPDGSWPAEYTIPLGTFQVETGPLPFEENPAFAVGVEEVDGEVPHQISLDQNYPNPFNPSTTFEYSIDQTQHVRVRVFDVTGRIVATLVDGMQPAATYRVTFDGADLASGLYVYQLETPTRTISKKMVLIK